MNYKKIIIVQTAFLGDVILITPLIKGLKQIFPVSDIDVLVIPQSKGILDNNPDINNIYYFDKRKNKLKAFIKTLKQIKQNKYNLAILPHSSFTTAMLTFFANIPERIGFDRGTAAKFLTKKTPFRHDVRRIEKNLDLLKFFSDKKFDIQTELFPDKETKKQADELLKNFNKDKTIAIAPGSVWDTKRWPEKYYKELSDKLVENGFNLVYIGSKQEQDLCEKIAPKNKTLILAGKASILLSAAIIEKCNLMICNDSGALHIANAVKTDVFAFFGPTVKSFGYSPFRKNDYVFEKDLDCRPCGNHGHKKCPLTHHNCMKMILPDEVLKQIINKH
ncbi:MAG: lipopolysaccharide heptosyltransferase II [Bacteroidales bacterium]|nr:lipopolysaccharide heptosyltransferase II [Bacteroidales bacterium]